jgi:PAS domain S-box-containing protein
MSAKVRIGGAGKVSAVTHLPVSLFAEIFEHVPDAAFFVKDTAGRYTAVNRSLAERVGFQRTEDLVGKTVRDVYPAELATRFARQDETVLRTGRPIVEKLELHWYPRRKTGWCFTTKFAIRDDAGKILGLVGISRDLQVPAGAGRIPAGLASALDHLESHYDEELSPTLLAERAGIPPVRFARLIKRLFRTTPSQLIAHTRLTAASRMLEESLKPVAEVAHACGFYDHSAFTRAFRAATGMTPTRFRQSRQGGV